MVPDVANYPESGSINAILTVSVIAGMALIIFETIADFGGVSTLRIETFTVGIYNAWFGYQSYFSAARLAGFLLLFVLVIIGITKYFGTSNLASKTSETFVKINLNNFYIRKRKNKSCAFFSYFSFSN